MRSRIALAFLLTGSVLLGVIIDRIAIVIGKAIIKDSDITRNVRETDFLNEQPLNMTLSARRAAASRLIDQVLIRQEIRLGDYPRATAEQAEQELSGVVKQRFRTQEALQNALKRYGINELQLREDFRWQLTVLRFIEARFKPAVFINDEAIKNYYIQHVVELRHEHPQESSLNALSGSIRDTLTEEQVNKLFFDWLDQQRKEAKIEYFEEGLR